MDDRDVAEEIQLLDQPQRNLEEEIRLNGDQEGRSPSSASLNLRGCAFWLVALLFVVVMAAGMVALSAERRRQQRLDQLAITATWVAVLPTATFSQLPPGRMYCQPTTAAGSQQVASVIETSYAHYWAEERLAFLLLLELNTRLQAVADKDAIDLGAQLEEMRCSFQDESDIPYLHFRQRMVAEAEIEVEDALAAANAIAQNRRLPPGDKQTEFRALEQRYGKTLVDGIMKRIPVYDGQSGAYLAYDSFMGGGMLLFQPAGLPPNERDPVGNGLSVHFQSSATNLDGMLNLSQE